MLTWALKSEPSNGKVILWVNALASVNVIVKLFKTPFIACLSTPQVDASATRGNGVNRRSSSSDKGQRSVGFHCNTLAIRLTFTPSVPAAPTGRVLTQANHQLSCHVLFQRVVFKSVSAY